MNYTIHVSLDSTGTISLTCVLALLFLSVEIVIYCLKTLGHPFQCQCYILQTCKIEFCWILWYLFQTNKLCLIL
jgi:hypothetical protein